MKKKMSGKNKKGQLFVNFGAICLACSIGGKIAINSLPIGERYKVVAVSEDVRESIYKDNMFVDYISEKAPIYEEKEDLEDEFLTKKTLKEVAYLNIDMLENKDLSFLSSCTSLKQLLILNAQCLTKEEVSFLARLEGVELYLTFDFLAVMKSEEKFDVTPLQGKNVTVLSNGYGDNLELMGVLLGSFLEGYDESFNNRYISYELFEKITKFLDECMGSIDFNKDCKEELLGQLLNFVIKLIDYDPDVGFYLDDYQGGGVDDLINQKAIKYNNKSLSSLLDCDYPTYGICKNYASLLVALCQKWGIEAYVVMGTQKSNGVGHAWVLVSIDGQYYYVDPTRLEFNPIFSFSCQSYLNTEDPNAKEKFGNILKSIIMQDVDSSSYNSTFDIQQGIDLLMDTVSYERQEVLYNETLEENGTSNSSFDQCFPWLIGSGTFSLGYGLIRQRKREK